MNAINQCYTVYCTMYHAVTSYSITKSDVNRFQDKYTQNAVYMLQTTCTLCHGPFGHNGITTELIDSSGRLGWYIGCVRAMLRDSGKISAFVKLVFFLRV